MQDTALHALSDFPHTLEIFVRWSDYDMANHVNNVKFYAYFEDVVVDMLNQVGLNWSTDGAIPFVVESGCNFLAPIPFPSKVVAGIGISKFGTSSLTYDIGLFIVGQEGEADKLVARGHFVHVFVDRETDRPTPMPEWLREKAQRFALK